MIDIINFCGLIQMKAVLNMVLYIINANFEVVWYETYFLRNCFVLFENS